MRVLASPSFVRFPDADIRLLCSYFERSKTMDLNNRRRLFTRWVLLKCLMSAMLLVSSVLSYGGGEEERHLVTLGVGNYPLLLLLLLDR